MSASPPIAESDRDVWMSVTFTPSVEDQARYYDFCFSEQKTRAAALAKLRRKSSMFVWLPIGLAVAFILAKDLLPDLMTPWVRGLILGTFIGPVLALFSMSLWIRFVGRRQSQASTTEQALAGEIRDGLIGFDEGSRTVELTAHGIRSTSNSVELRVRWEAIERIVDHRGTLLVLFLVSNAFVIPRSAFAAASDADRFITLVQRHLRRGPGGAGAPPTARAPLAGPSR